TQGELDAYVPLADWGVRVRAFSAPMSVRVEPRRVDRDAVLRAANGDRAITAGVEDDLRDAIGATVARMLRFALGGAALLALMLGLALAAFGERRRLRLVGLPLLVLVLAAAVCGATIWRAEATFDAGAVDHPTFYARGAELVQLLDAAENARRAGDGYGSKVEGAVRGFASLLAAPTAGRLDGGPQALLASDLHDNRLVLDSVRDYAAGKPVFFVGDFGRDGDASETRLLAPAVAGLGRRVVAVSGNHDSTRLMRALARRGVTVLTRRGALHADGSHGAAMTRVAGLLVAGFDDPLEWHGPNPGASERVFSFSELPDPESAAARADRQLLRWFDGLPRRPDVVLVHQNGLAQRLARTLLERGDPPQLTILTGHDHAQHVTNYGPIAVIDAGTVGASGIYGVGRDVVGLGDLHFSSTATIEAVDLIAVEPVSGAAEARRVLLEDCARASGVCQRYPLPGDEADPPNP
ncbi:MAG TPA: metallophosphoesterase family protein, partial [Thermoleophilaceae bacterium]